MKIKDVIKKKCCLNRYKCQSNKIRFLKNVHVIVKKQKIVLTALTKQPWIYFKNSTTP